MKAEQYATKQPMDHWRNQRGNKTYERQMKMKTQQSKTYRTVYINTILPLERRNISGKKPTAKATTERRTNKIQS